MPKKKITVARLKELGIHGREWPDDLEADCIRDVDSSHSDKVRIIFEDEGRLWRLYVWHHPEDWSGTNDLREWEGQPDHEFEVTEVEKAVREVWVAKKSEETG